MIGQAKDRFSSEEARAIDRLQLDMYNEVRQVNPKPTTWLFQNNRKLVSRWLMFGDLERSDSGAYLGSTLTFFSVWGGS